MPLKIETDPTHFTRKYFHLAHKVHLSLILFKIMQKAYYFLPFIQQKVYKISAYVF